MTFGSCGKKDKKKKERITEQQCVFSRNDDFVVSSFMQELVSFDQITPVDRFREGILVRNCPALSRANSSFAFFFELCSIQ